MSSRHLSLKASAQVVQQLQIQTMNKQPLLAEAKEL